MRDVLLVCGGFAAGAVLDAIYQKRVLAAATREAGALRGMLDHYRGTLSEIVNAIKIKL